MPLGDAELEQVRRKFGMVFQAAALFDSMNVFENVAFPLREHRKELVRGADARSWCAPSWKLMGLPASVEAKLPGGPVRRHAQARGPGARRRARAEDRPL